MNEPKDQATIKFTRLQNYKGDKYVLVSDIHLEMLCQDFPNKLPPLRDIEDAIRCEVMDRVKNLVSDKLGDVLPLTIPKCWWERKPWKAMLSKDKRYPKNAGNCIAKATSSSEAQSAT